MCRGVEQALAQRHRAIDVDDHGNAAPDRFGAQVGAEFGAAAFGEDGVWTALGNGDGTFQPPRRVLQNFGYSDSAGGWRVEKHPRFVAKLSETGGASIIAFGDDGVWTAVGDQKGGFANGNRVFRSIHVLPFLGGILALHTSMFGKTPMPRLAHMRMRSKRIQRMHASCTRRISCASVPEPAHLND